MKTLLHFLAATLLAQMANAQNAEEHELQRIITMTKTLNGGGIAGLLKQAKENAWEVPHIPSQWHVEHVSKVEWKSSDITARQFGKSLAKQLAEEASKVQLLSVDNALYDETTLLIDLSDWCAATDGYGNIYLAQRSLDIAAVGVARLAANLDFQIKKIDSLLSRMNPSWMSAEVSQRVLNKDAGAYIFPEANREKMERIWGSGRIIMRMKANPEIKSDLESRGIADSLYRSKAVEENLSFFDDVEVGQLNPITLVNLWDYNWHGRLVVGLELQGIQKAKALAEFRHAIGKFPEKPIFTAEQLQERERGAAAAVKAGLKVSNMEDSYASPMAAAFALAWKGYLEKQGEDLGKLSPLRYNLDASAYQAYDEVKRGVFFDQDTANARLYEAQTKTP